MVAGEPTIPVHITQYWGQRIADLTAERDALTVEVEALRSTVARIADIGNRKTDGNFATLCRLAEEVLRCAREAAPHSYQLFVTDVWSPEQLEHDAGTHEPISVDEAIEALTRKHDEEVNTDD